MSTKSATVANKAGSKRVAGKAPKRSSRLKEKPTATKPKWAAARVFEIIFPAFTARIAIRSGRELTVKIVAGDNAGFSDTVDYEAIAVRDGLVVLSWREPIGSTIVHVLDFACGNAYTAVTPAKGGFMRLSGRIQIKSAT